MDKTKELPRNWMGGHTQSCSQQDNIQAETSEEWHSSAIHAGTGSI